LYNDDLVSDRGASPPCGTVDERGDEAGDEEADDTGDDGRDFGGIVEASKDPEDKGGDDRTDEDENEFPFQRSSSHVSNFASRSADLIRCDSALQKRILPVKRNHSGVGTRIMVSSPDDTSCACSEPDPDSALDSNPPMSRTTLVCRGASTTSDLDCVL